MEYMFVLFADEAEDDYSHEALAEWTRFEGYAETVAKQIAGGALQGAATATVLATRDGNAVVTDGPFIDAKEQLAGYYVYDCGTRETALDLAARIPIVNVGHVEVRPMVDFSALTA